MPLNLSFVLDSRPQTHASADNFKLIQADTPPLQDGQVLVQHHYLSLDPYMRGRMNDSKSYAAPQPLGEVMIGGTAGMKEMLQFSADHKCFPKVEVVDFADANAGVAKVLANAARYRMVLKIEGFRAKQLGTA